MNHRLTATTKKPVPGLRNLILNGYKWPLKQYEPVVLNLPHAVNFKAILCCGDSQA